MSAGLTPEQMSKGAFADLERALSMVRTASRALGPVADTPVGGPNPGAELVASDVVGTLEVAAELFCESLYTLQVRVGVRP